MISKHGFDTTKQRSDLMKKIKSRDTKPEVKLRKKLWSLGYRYRKNLKTLPGKPDIVFTKFRIAIFVDGEFWHGYEWEKKKNRIKSNREYWIKKIEKNMARDKEYNKELSDMGYRVLRFWENDVKNNIDGCVKKILDEIHVSDNI